MLEAGRYEGWRVQESKVNCKTVCSRTPTSRSFGKGDSWLLVPTHSPSHSYTVPSRSHEPQRSCAGRGGRCGRFSALAIDQRRKSSSQSRQFHAFHASFLPTIHPQRINIYVSHSLPRRCWPSSRTASSVGIRTTVSFPILHVAAWHSAWPRGFDSHRSVL